MRWVISQGKSHSTFVAPVRRQFKGSLAIGTEGHLRHPPASHAMFDGVLGTSRLPDDFELLPIHGHLFEEVMILDRPSKTLIGQDVAAFADGGSFLNRLYTFSFGLLGGVGFPSFSLMLWQKLPAFHASLIRVRDAEFTRAIGAHSTAVPRDGDAALLRRSIDEALAIGNLGHKAMLGRYFASQPGFLRDLLRYLKTSKGKPGARLREATGSDA